MPAVLFVLQDLGAFFGLLVLAQDGLFPLPEAVDETGRHFFSNQALPRLGIVDHLHHEAGWVLQNLPGALLLAAELESDCTPIQQVAAFGRGNSSVQSSADETECGVWYNTFIL